MVEKKISVVLCTYNGAKFIKEQLESIIVQTLQPYEIIAQDDGSTDETMEILQDYAKKYPFIKVYRNEKERGINNNFFSAIHRATGNFIAISDQDDIWMQNKLDIMTQSIGDNLMCVARSIPFYNKEDKEVSIHFDKRKPNCNIIRMLYASMPGHCTLFRKELLSYLPADLETSPIYTHTWYDVILGQTAAAQDRIILIDKVVVKQRRYIGAASYSAYDKKRTRSANNVPFIVWFGIRNYRKIKPLMCKHFSVRGGFIKSIQADNDIYRDAVKLMDLECKTGWIALLGLIKMYMKYRHILFYTYEKDPIAFIRAILHPFMQVYNYRYLWERENKTE